MNFELDGDHKMIVDLVSRFVHDELMPLEGTVLARDAAGEEVHLDRSETDRLNQRARELGLWGFDAPEEYGGADLPHIVVAAANIEIGKTITPYTFPPDSPNLRMLMAAASDQQKERYLAPYVQGETISAMGISEPGAGSDPRRMRTRARRVEGGWVINGTKIWISKADRADFTIVMALTSPREAARPSMSAFLVDAASKGITVSSPIRMIGGHYTYEVALDEVFVEDGAMLGEEGKGFGPMQVRLATRRLEMVCWAIGLAERALDLMLSHVKDRVTFGQPLSERQAIQWWIADAATFIRTCRLLAMETAWRMDQGEDVTTLVSMAKFHATETAYKIVDNVMQSFGAMGMSKEMPLHLMAGQLRLMRIYDGPTEVHKWVVARNILRES